MYRILALFFIFNFSNYLYGQSNRVAILDFENISGISKYDGLGKAMSSMLISDIEANVSPKRLQLIERSQLQKVLKEQNLQASGNVNKNTAVKTGKILGVNYILVGDVYILNDQLIINARLTNTETGDIIFSKKQEGKLLSWLNLKTNIAKDIAASFSQPFTEPTIPDNDISLATLTTYGNAITAKDKGDTSLADKLVETIQEFSPDFKYVEDLKKEINQIKEQLLVQSKKIATLEQSGGRVVNAKTYIECYNNLINPLTDDSTAIYYLEYIIDHFPKEASLNQELYAYPLIWNDIKWKFFISNKKLVISDLTRMINHINYTNNKSIASHIYAQRIQFINLWINSNKENGEFFDQDVQKMIFNLNDLIANFK